MTWYEYDGAMDFLNMMKRWNDNGYFTKSALSDTDSQRYRPARQPAPFTTSIPTRSRAIDKPEWNFKFANFVQDVSNLPFTQDALVISNTAENPERALALYDLITSDEDAYRAFYYGIEGTSLRLLTIRSSLWIPTTMHSLPAGQPVPQSLTCPLMVLPRM